MSKSGRMFAATIAALALVVSSTAVAAAPPAQPAAQQAANPWMTLSMLTPVGATTLGTAGVAAQAPEDERRDDGIGRIPIPVLVIWLGTIAAMVYIATHDDHDGLPTASPD